MPPLAMYAFRAWGTASEHKAASSREWRENKPRTNVQPDGTTRLKAGLHTIEGPFGVPPSGGRRLLSRHSRLDAAFGTWPAWHGPSAHGLASPRREDRENGFPVLGIVGVGGPRQAAPGREANDITLIR